MYITCVVWFLLTNMHRHTKHPEHKPHPPSPSTSGTLSTCMAVQAVPSLQGGQTPLPVAPSPPSPAACWGWSWKVTAGPAPCGCPLPACRSQSVSGPRAFLWSPCCGQFWTWRCPLLAGRCLLGREGRFPKGSKRGWGFCASPVEKQCLLGVGVVWALLLVWLVHRGLELEPHMASGLAAGFDWESEVSLTGKAAGFHFHLNVSVAAAFCLCGRNFVCVPAWHCQPDNSRSGRGVCG